MTSKAKLLLLAGLFVIPVTVVMAFAVAPAPEQEKPKQETVTITVEIAEKLVQSSILQQQQISSLKQELFLWQQEVMTMRKRMCA